jgi:hypothetical protein
LFEKDDLLLMMGSLSEEEMESLGEGMKKGD